MVHHGSFLHIDAMGQHYQVSIYKANAQFHGQGKRIKFVCRKGCKKFNAITKKTMQNVESDIDACICSCFYFA
ncbi:hypothetical protein D8Y20_05370 [Mariprofundus sp. EBB-1]|nr:hypothetical protein D8Y20_05370 [Mariprofundus sp. EBB-1]